MLLLKTFCRDGADNKTLPGDDRDNENLRNYQRDCWGRRDNDTCVIELFGLPAPNFKAYEALMCELFTQNQIDEILQERIQFIQKKIGEYKPKFVVMYGRGARKQWKKIAGRSFSDDEVFKVGCTIMVSATHPTAYGVGDAYWVELGIGLRRAAGMADAK